MPWRCCPLNPVLAGKQEDSLCQHGITVVFNYGKLVYKKTVHSRKILQTSLGLKITMSVFTKTLTVNVTCKSRLSVPDVQRLLNVNCFVFTWLHLTSRYAVQWKYQHHRGVYTDNYMVSLHSQSLDYFLIYNNDQYSSQETTPELNWYLVDILDTETKLNK